MENNEFEEDKGKTDSKLLAYLRILGRKSKDISLKDMKKFMIINMNDCGITDISILKYATEVEVLCLSGNNITDISCLSNMHHLRKLHLKRNKIEDLSVLAQLTKINEVRINFNPIKKFFSPEENRTSIEYDKWLGIISINRLMTSKQKEILDEYRFTLGKEAAIKALGKTPKMIMFIRNVLSQEEIEDVFKTVLSEPMTPFQYIKDFLLISPLGNQTGDFIGKNATNKVKSKALELILMNKL